MPPPHTFGYWLRIKRKSLDQTREEFARRVGCSAETIRKMEAEERRPSDQMAGRLAEIFDIPAGERKSFLAFARGDWKSMPGEASEEVPWQPAAATARSNLPAAVTSLVGREQEIARIHAELLTADMRLFTLVGPPGIGKTRLGLAAARSALSDFQDGVFFVPLASLENPTFVEPAILQALGLVESKSLPPGKQLIDGIGQKRMLLVLDNAEHLIDAVALIVTGLLSACPHLKILVTSQEVLRAPGEWRYTVPALRVPGKKAAIDIESATHFPGLTLFIERARAVRSDFTLDAGNMEAIASICARLDGLPLAIELLASRVRLMSPQALLERLNDTYLLSADGMRAVSPRQKTLENAIGWSYNHLTAEEQRVFACLAVFLNGFTLKTAEEVLGRINTAIPISDLVASLADKSLLQRGVAVDGEVRFSMLEIIQTFALNRLQSAGDEALARDLHLAFFLDLAETGDREMHGPAQAEWANRIENEHDNFRAALEWSLNSQNTASALRLLGALGWPWEVRGYYSEARCWLERIRGLSEIDRYPADYARLLNHIGRHNWTQGRNQEARALLEESRLLSPKFRPDEEPVFAETLNWLGLISIFVDKDLDAGEALVRQGLALFQKWGEPGGVALSTFHAGLIERERGNFDQALILLEQSLAAFQQCQDLFFVGRVANNIGYTLLNQGCYDGAFRYIEMNLKIDQKLQFWDGTADALLILGEYYRRTGANEQAVKSFEQSLAVCREHGLYMLNACQSSAMLALSMKNYGLAHERFRELLQGARRLGEETRSAIALLGLAAVAAGANRPERAARLQGAAEAILKKAQFSNRDYSYEAVQDMREMTGGAANPVLLAEGQALSLEQAVRYALENDQ